jgi:hypothetical protein
MRKAQLHPFLNPAMSMDDIPVFEQQVRQRREREADAAKTPLAPRRKSAQQLVEQERSPSTVVQVDAQPRRQVPARQAAGVGTASSAFEFGLAVDMPQQRGGKGAVFSPPSSARAGDGRRGSGSSAHDSPARAMYRSDPYALPRRSPREHEADAGDGKQRLLDMSAGVDCCEARRACCVVS